MKYLCSLIVMLICFSFASAQAITGETLKQQLVKDWERAKAYTQEYLDAMPADKYGFRPTPEIRSFGEQMLHFSQANVGMVFFATGYPDPVGRKFFGPEFEKSPISQNKDSVTYYVKASYDYAINAIKSADVTKFQEVISQQLRAGLRTAPRIAWLLKAFEHQTHHRGQCTIYLRLSGITPPGEKLWD